jgi:hypothetical protein
MIMGLRPSVIFACSGLHFTEVVSIGSTDEFHPTTVISPESMVHIYFGVWDSGLFIVSTSLFSWSDISKSLNIEHLNFIHMYSFNPTRLIRSNGCREFVHLVSLALGLAYPILPLDLIRQSF